jgi:hypothetical protein
LIYKICVDDVDTERSEYAQLLLNPTFKNITNSLSIKIENQKPVVGSTEARSFFLNEKRTKKIKADKKSQAF